MEFGMEKKGKDDKINCKINCNIKGKNNSIKYRI